MHDIINGKRSVYFNEPSDKYYRLRNMGYEDFHIAMPCMFSRIFNWYTFHFVVQGRGKLILKGCEYDVTAGDFFFVPRQESALYYCSTQEPWVYYWMTFSSSTHFDFDEILGVSEESPVRAAKHPDKVGKLFYTLFESPAQGTELSYCALATFLQLISLEYVKENTPTKSDLSNDKIISNVKRIIELNYFRSDLSIRDVADMNTISQRHMDRIFKNTTQMTPKEYLVDIRLTHAAALLQKQKYSVHDLCTSVGFNDEFHFMRCFKKKFGMSTKAYRNQYITKEI